MAEARQHFLTALHRFDELRHVLGPGVGEWVGAADGTEKTAPTYVPIEMSMRMTASLAPPAQGRQWKA
jgi:hypothetical protein